MSRTCPHDGAVLRISYRANDGYSYHVCPECKKTFAGLLQSWEAAE